jgi:hypothetical protein
VFIQDPTTNYVYQSASVAEGHFTTSAIHNLTNNNSSFSIYPNPAKGYSNLAFNLNSEGNVEVTLYNLLGENINTLQNGKMTAGQHLITFSTASLQPGVYFVKYITDNQSITKRLVIQR